MSTENPWEGLSREAHAGALQFNPGAADAAATMAADASYILGVLKSNASKFETHNVFGGTAPNQPSTTLPSAQDLMARFNQQGRNFGDVVGKYIELIDSMADTLIWAGKKYKSVDEDSAKAFGRYKDGAKARIESSLPSALHVPTEAPKNNVTFKKELEGLLGGPLGDSGLPKVSGQKYGDPIGAESPYGRGVEWFRGIRNTLAPEFLGSNSQLWEWAAVNIAGVFNPLATRLETMATDGDWAHSKGQQGALAAVNSFKAQSHDLAVDLAALAATVLNTQEWMISFRGGLAELQGAWSSQQARDDALEKTWTTAFTNIYTPNLTASSTAIPKLTDPTAKPPARTDGGGGDGGGGGGTGTGGGGGGTGRGGGGGGSGIDPSKLGIRSATLPDGTKINPDGTRTNLDGTKTNPDGTKANPDGTKTNPDGTKTNPDGTKTNPSTTNPSGTGNSSNSSSGSSDSSSLLSALQQGLSALTSTTSTSPTSTSPTTTSPTTTNPVSSLLKDLAKDIKGGGGAGGGGAGGGAPKDTTQRLFPRAALTAETAETSTAGIRTGVAAASTGTGMGGGMGGGGMGPMGHGAQGGQGKGEHKRPEFLDSTEYLEEAMGEAPIVAKPVVEG
ncbi:hypothetical protein AB0N05_21795 [Nocardia sp. NPDC051030]|uniref:hypothetical protein n=1 Tax=Nocardia sp. NPDC051030 TaxID=3155162 RepID=UPI003417D86C